MQKQHVHPTETRATKDLQHETILLIDDDSDILLLNKTILEMEDFEVFTAQSGQEALKILNEIPFPQLILLDMKMNEMSGPEFLKKLEQERPDVVDAVPIVFMTGMAQVPACRAAGFIQKPTEIAHFLKAVREFIDCGPASIVEH